MGGEDALPSLARTLCWFCSVNSILSKFRGVPMEVILRLQCDDVPGGRIERETPTGLVTIATVAREADGLAVHVITARRRRAWSISRVFGHGTVMNCSGGWVERM
jgi:hypothetical protein